jgi:hypothetical protein
VGVCNPSVGGGGAGVPPEQRASVPGPGQRPSHPLSEWGGNLRGLHLRRPGLLLPLHTVPFPATASSNPRLRCHAAREWMQKYCGGSLLWPMR